MEKTGYASQTCQSRLSSLGDALYVIGGKWKLRIIIALTEGNKRFNEIQRTVEGISARVLSNELKDLEMNGFLIRQVYADVPVVIEYQLTSYSETLQPVLEALSSWGMLHKEKIKKERRGGSRKNKAGVAA